jgi:hypothetical protein
VAQWTLLLREAFRGSGASFGAIVSRLTLPLIAIAEVFSWYATLTTNFIGSVVEESLWATTSALMTLSFVRLWWRSSLGRRRLVRVAFALNVAYVAFMLMVDIPMYLSRWRADQAAGRAYLSVAEGWTDALHRRVITRRWEDWWQEMPWMSLYFSAGVWLSMALVRAPALGDRRPPTVRT